MSDQLEMALVLGMVHRIQSRSIQLALFCFLTDLPMRLSSVLSPGLGLS